jgi:hypothetical protein
MHHKRTAPATRGDLRGRRLPHRAQVLIPIKFVVLWGAKMRTRFCFVRGVPLIRNSTAGLIRLDGTEWKVFGRGLVRFTHHVEQGGLADLGNRNSRRRDRGCARAVQARKIHLVGRRCPFSACSCAQGTIGWPGRCQCTRAHDKCFDLAMFCRPATAYRTRPKRRAPKLGAASAFFGGMDETTAKADKRSGLPPNAVVM